MRIKTTIEGFGLIMTIEKFKGLKICSPNGLENKNGIWYFMPYELDNSVFSTSYSYLKHESSIVIDSKENITYFRIEYLAPNYDLNKILWDKYCSYKQFLEFGKEGEYEKQIEICKYYPEFGDVSTITDRESEFESIRNYEKFHYSQCREEQKKNRFVRDLMTQNYNTVLEILKGQNFIGDVEYFYVDVNIKYDFESDIYKDIMYKWFPMV